jgi:hypothetical protein
MESPLTRRSIEHDQLPLVLDSDEAGHPVLCVSVRSFSGVVEDFTSTDRQADLWYSVSSFLSLLCFPDADFVGVSSRSKIDFGYLPVSGFFACFLVFSQTI